MLSPLRTLAAALLLVSPASTVGAASILPAGPRLTASDAESGDRFGISVAVSGDRALVGADGEGLPPLWPGAVYLFERDDGGSGAWGEVAKLTPAAGSNQIGFGISVALSGGTAVVGAHKAFVSGVRTGAAYVFEPDLLGDWQLRATLSGNDAEPNDEFGYSVAISGDRILVGARKDEDAGDGSGSAYIFERDAGGPGSWGQVAKLTASDAAAQDNFGHAVALAGDTAVVGAPLDDDAGGASGAAYVFERDSGGAWAETAKLTASDAGANGIFGTAVSLSGDTTLVGAQGHTHDTLRTGSAYVFERNAGGPGAWGETVELIASDAAADARFGSATAIAGDAAVVGASLADNDLGSAYIFDRDAGGADAWGEVAQLAAASAPGDQQFGSAAAISGSTALAAAHRDDFADFNAGAAYIAELNGVLAHCGNGLDDDGDGRVDHPDDPGCASPTDLSERSPSLPCDDGADNDGDGAADFGGDDDADGISDPPGDSGCRDPAWPLEDPQCQDGLNNDTGQDPDPGRIDFDGGASLDLDDDGFVDAAFNPATPAVTAPDPQCSARPWKNKEKQNKRCGLGYELAGLLPLLLFLRRRARPHARR